LKTKALLAGGKIYVKTGTHKFSKHLAATSKFYVTER